MAKKQFVDTTEADRLFAELERKEAFVPAGGQAMPPEMMPPGGMPPGGMPPEMMGPAPMGAMPQPGMLPPMGVPATPEAIGQEMVTVPPGTVLVNADELKKLMAENGEEGEGKEEQKTPAELAARVETLEQQVKELMSVIAGLMPIPGMGGPAPPPQAAGPQAATSPLPQPAGRNVGIGVPAAVKSISKADLPKEVKQTLDFIDSLSAGRSE